MAEHFPEGEAVVPAVIAGEAELAVDGLREGFGDTGPDLDAVAEVTRTIDLAQ